MGTSYTATEDGLTEILTCASTANEAEKVTIIGDVEWVSIRPIGGAGRFSLVGTDAAALSDNYMPVTADTERSRWLRSKIVAGVLQVEFYVAHEDSSGQIAIEAGRGPRP